MDLSSYDRQELLKLRKQIDQELEARRRVDQRTARQEIKDVAAKYGLTLSDIIGVSGGRAGSRSSESNAVYQHPTDPRKTWSGRGRKPNWLREWEAAGHSLDELRQ